VDATAADQLDSQLKAVTDKLNRFGQDQAQIAEAADRAAATANALAQRLWTQPYTRDFNVRVLRNISADAGAISLSGERSAEQAVMAVDSLTLACTPPLQQAAAVQTGINSMFTQLQNPSAYNAKTFETQLKGIGRLLP
jgi:small-conductance mechanosensitive channel